MGVASEFAWPGEASSAVSLTFDGGFLEHWELVVPILSEAGLKGTFFLTVPSLLENPGAWKNVVAQGHEIGSHSHYGISVDGELSGWTLEMVREDLRMTDKGIVEILECPVTSFAMSGVSTLCADGDFFPILKRQFSSLRSAEHGKNDIEDLDVFHVRSLPWRSLSGDISAYLPKAGEWAVPVFERFFDVQSASAEDDLRFYIEQLKNQPNTWVATFAEVSTYVSSHAASLNRVG